MPKESAATKDRDFAVQALRVVEEITGEHLNGTPLEQTRDDKNPHAVALGQLGGKKGGRARAERLSPKRRSEIARKAAAARWKRP